MLLARRWKLILAINLYYIVPLADWPEPSHDREPSAEQSESEQREWSRRARRAGELALAGGGGEPLPGGSGVSGEQQEQSSWRPTLLVSHPGHVVHLDHWWSDGPESTEGPSFSSEPACLRFAYDVQADLEDPRLTLVCELIEAPD